MRTETPPSRAHTLHRSLLWFRRGLRHELRLPLAGLALAAATVGGVAVFAAQLESTVTHAADGALGADLVVHAATPLPSSLAALARRLGLRTATVVEFPTVAVAGRRLRLATLRAVSASYPLRGEMRLRTRRGEPARPASGAPSPGTVWASPALLAALDLGARGTLSLGGKQFVVAALIGRAPGTRLDFTRIAPLVIVNIADLPATGLAGTQSRVEYQLLLAGPPAALARFRKRATALLPPDAGLRDVRDVTPELRAPLTATGNFLRLAVLATLLIAAAALIQSARHYRLTQERSAAVLKTLGAGRSNVRLLYALELGWLVLAASALGTLAAWGIARALAALGTHWFGLALDPAPLPVLLTAPAAAAVLGAGFWLVPALGLAAARPGTTLRGATPAVRRNLLEAAAAVGALAALLLWQGADRVALALWALAAAGALVIVLAGLGLILLRAAGAPPAGIRPAWRYGIAALARRRARSLVELVAFGLALAVILLLTGVRHDLVASWRASVPADAPDHFVINIQPDESERVRAFLADRLAARPRLYPMTKARLVSIDGVPVGTWKGRLRSQRGRDLLLREQTLSMRAEPGPGNKIVAGHWWRSADAGRKWVSAEADWARELGIGLGDRLRFSVADRDLTLVVTSLRSVDWQSFEPNFFLVTPPDTLNGYPATWITAVHTGGNQSIALDLLHRFPELTVVDVGAIIDSVTALLGRASAAIAAMFGLAASAAILVLLAALEAGRARRARELALLRVLGARRRQLALALAAEFGLLGALSGASAGLVAAAAGLVLGHRVFDLSVNFDGWLIGVGVLAGTVGIGGIGLAATLRLTRLPPLRALRERDG